MADAKPIAAAEAASAAVVGGDAAELQPAQTVASKHTCPCVECECGDDCKCKPGEPGCGPCGEFQKANMAAKSGA